MAFENFPYIDSAQITEFAESAVQFMMDAQDPIKTMPSIRVNFTDSLGVEAYVKQESRGEYLIQVSSGVPIILFKVYCKALENNKFMPWIRRNSTSKTSPEIRSDMVSIEDVFPAGAIDPPSLALPSSLNDVFYAGFSAEQKALLDSNPDRIEAASWLMVQALRFLLAHETRHVLAGHCDYSETIFGIDSISETETIKLKEDANYLRLRSLEADADDWAIKHLMNYLVNAFKQYPDFDKDCGVCLNDPWHVVLVTLLCINAVFHLLDSPRRPVHTLFRATHPSLTYRRVCVLTWAYQCAKLLELPTYRGAKDGLSFTDGIWYLVDANLTNVFGDDYPRSFKNLSKELKNNEIQSIGADLDEAYIALQPYTYVELP